MPILYATNCSLLISIHQPPTNPNPPKISLNPILPPSFRPIRYPLTSRRSSYYLFRDLVVAKQFNTSILLAVLLLPQLYLLEIDHTIWGWTKFIMLTIHISSLLLQYESFASQYHFGAINQSNLPFITGCHFVLWWILVCKFLVFLQELFKISKALCKGSNVFQHRLPDFNRSTK